MQVIKLVGQFLHLVVFLYSLAMELWDSYATLAVPLWGNIQSCLYSW
jgi:hypothetical protein